MAPQHDEQPATAVPETAGACGICCEGCHLYIATREDPDSLPALAERMGWALEETYCEGCRTSRRSPFCRDCDLRGCVERRGIDFCNQCPDYPCAELRAFQREKPHRSEIFENLDRIAQVGAANWLEEARQRFVCPECGVVNGWYALQCCRCGHKPGNAFVTDHLEAIVASRRER